MMQSDVNMFRENMGYGLLLKKETSVHYFIVAIILLQI